MQKIQKIVSVFVAIVCCGLAIAAPVFACECGRAGPACAYVNSANAVFVGKVVFTDDDGTGTFTQKTSVHFEVEESFKGLGAGVRDVWIDPGSYTSCYEEYHVGERWLLFAYRGGVFPVDSPAMTVERSDGKKAKPLPPGIDAKNPPVFFYAPECSGSRQITESTEKSVQREIEYLRAFKAGTAKPLITGRVTVDDDFGIFNPPPLVGALVKMSGNGMERTARSDEEGRYTFEGTAPGSYVINATFPAYRAKGGEKKVKVTAIGCGAADFDMLGTGAIEGQLLDHEGKPIPNAKVTVLRLGSDHKPVFYGFRETNANHDGKFKFENLPEGEFEIGVNLAFAPDEERPFAPTKWMENGVSAIALRAGEHKKISPLRLASALAGHTIPVVVRWEDGKPAAGVHVWAEVPNEVNGSGVGDHHETDAEGRARLTLLEGVTYTVEAKIWVGQSPHREVARSGAVQVTATMETEKLELRLVQRTKDYR